MNVQPAAQPGFNLTVTPSSRTISQDDSTSYSVSITRLNGFSGNVALSVAGLPKKTTGTFSPGTMPGPSELPPTLAIVSQHNADIGTFTLTVTGTGGSPVVTRTASVTLRIDKKHDFSISGNAGSILYPGKTSDVDLTLTNPNNFTIRVSALGISVEEQTTNSACSGTQNFATTALVGTVDVPSNTTATLSQLGVAPARLPKVTFLNTAGEPGRVQERHRHPAVRRYGGETVRRLIHTLARRHEACLAREADAAIARERREAALRTAATDGVGRRRRRRRLTMGRLSLAGALAVGLVAGAGVFAYWTTGGSGSAAASVGGLDAPSGVTATNTFGSGTVATLVDRGDRTGCRAGRRVLRDARRRLDRRGGLFYDAFLADLDDVV